MSRSLTCEELTPRGRGGVSVLALRGPGARARAAELAGRALPERGVVHAELRAAGEWLDEALLVLRGDELVELHLHGSPAVVSRLRGELELSAREPRSAEERAARLLGTAPTEDGARILLDQAEGALRRTLERLVPAAPHEARAGVARLLARGRRAEPLLRPLRVVLAGPANAGKSTLFNALAGEERAVVSEEAGTTRDALEARVQLGPYAVDLVDTAGERDTEADPRGLLEREGQLLGRRRRGRADLVVWLHPADDGRERPAPEAGPPPRAVLDSRADRVPAGRRASLDAPLRALEDPAGARRLLERVLRETLGPEEPVWRAGLAVPFDAATREGLAAWPAEASSQERHLHALRWLGPPPAEVRPLAGAPAAD